MLKILIADDEALVRAGIRVLLDWETYGFEIIGEAADGEEAWQALLSLDPDILLTDIRMPKMDGIELLKKMKAHNLPVFTIILSCFDDFELVREAMKFGAKDYILKLSVTPDALLNILNEIRPQILADKETLCPPASIKTEDLKYLLVKKLIGRSYTDGFQVSNIIQNLSLSISLDRYELIVFQIVKTNKYNEKNIRSSQQSADMIYHLCNQTCRQFEGCELSAFDDGRLLMIHSGAIDSRTICFRLRDVLKNYTTALFFFGVSNSTCAYSGFPEAASQAVISLETAFFYQTELLEFKHLTPLCPSLLYSNQEEQQLFDALITQNTSAATALLDKILNRLKKNFYSRTECIEFSTELLGAFCRVAKSLDISFYDILYDNQPVTDVLKQQLHLEALIRALKAFAGIFVSCISEAIQSRYRSEISLIKDYIHSHYAENIDLNSAAKLVNISPSHLSVLFKKETGENFSSYLIAYRMKIAKGLLLHPDTCIYEIAEQTGYSNSSYFGKAFKKYYGISPEEFRKNMNIKK